MIKKKELRIEMKKSLVNCFLLKKKKKWSLHLSQKESECINDLIIKFQDMDNCWIKKEKKKKNNEQLIQIQI